MADFTKNVSHKIILVPYINGIMDVTVMAFYREAIYSHFHKWFDFTFVSKDLVFEEKCGHEIWLNYSYSLMERLKIQVWHIIWIFLIKVA